jgi:hypothetical protein
MPKLRAKPSRTEMTVCALCTAELTENNCTREHILPSAIGGRLKVAGFICRKCNSTAGNLWEAELAKQLNWFSVALNINRESGTRPPSHAIKTVTGEKLLMHAGGSFTPRDADFKWLDSVGGKRRFSFTARTVGEAQKILKGVQKKHPSSNLQQILNDLRITSQPLEEPVHVELSIGGPNVGRSIVKTAVAMACHMSISMTDCAFALRFLIDPDADAAWSAFHLRDLIVNRPSAHLFHVVSVAGDPNSGRLLGYVEYFGAFRYIVVLGQDYRGPAVNKTYAINPVTSEELQFKVDLSLSDAEMALVALGEAGPIEGLKADFELALPIVLAARNAHGRNQLLNDVLTETFHECGVRPGDDLPPERFEDFSARLAEKLAALLVRLPR